MAFERSESSSLVQIFTTIGSLCGFRSISCEYKKDMQLRLSVTTALRWQEKISPGSSEPQLFNQSVHKVPPWNNSLSLPWVKKISSANNGGSSQSRPTNPIKSPWDNKRRVMREGVLDQRGATRQRCLENTAQLLISCSKLTARLTATSWFVDPAWLEMFL